MFKFLSKNDFPDTVSTESTRSQAVSSDWSMSPEERQRLYELFSQIEKEKDHNRFLRLVQELNQLLERTEKRLDKNATN